MMMQEFIDRTGFEPSIEEYKEIEEAYYRFDGNKDAFCKRWKEDGGADRLAKERLRQIEALKKELASEKERANKEILKLTSALDKELNWIPSDNTGTNMQQERYEHLQNSTGTVVMTEVDAKDFLNREVGFDIKKIEIVETVSEYEVNKYRRLRVSGSYERKPLYNASDWNYIRFNCAGWQYEFINGRLEPYLC